MSVRRPALAVALLCAGLVAVPQSASAYPSPPPAVQCGQTLTVDTVLTRNLTCTGDGLVLAPGVSLDLGGRTLRGSGAGVGVTVDTLGTSVVRNGTLAGWATAVGTTWIEESEPDAGPLTVDRVRFRDNVVGVDASGEGGTGRYRKPTTVTGSSFSGHTRAAVDGNWYGQVVVDRTTFTDNTIGVWNSGDATVRRSRFVRNDRAVIGVEAVVTIEDSTFEDNLVGVGAYMIGTTTVRGSRFVRSGVAVDGAGHYTHVDSSAFQGNERAVVLGELGGSVTGSTLRDNGEAIALDGDGLANSEVHDNVLRRNGEGIVLDGDLFQVGVGGNDVRGSTGWGIYAPGATDLGGNTARGNGSDPQCVGVVCATP